MAASILIVEGKAGEHSFALALEKAGYQAHVVHTGASALSTIAQSPIHLIVFDAAYMRTNGARTCHRLRRAAEATPIIHIRGQQQSMDNVVEVDVFMQRPFTPRKLLNRIRALLPADEIKEEVVRYGSICLYRTKRSVEVNGQGENQLTPKLTLLLEEFIRHPNEVISRRQLMQNVWDTDYIGDTRTLDVHIRWMRELIEDDPAHPVILRTIRNKGYIFCHPSFAAHNSK
ncbi:MAG: response regulator transcription factor [Chloroflexi bacterium]|nr:response regulator transcription factor [Ardenticatenaceae bacterium]MBL1130654.1 DNA-binding response regulator [Chloroflexota bacterium]NOG36748.1 response regulator transcription factor [Chloroflexota bacterium]